MGHSISIAFISLIFALASKTAWAQDIENFNFEQHVEKVKDPNQVDYLVGSALTWGDSFLLERNSDKQKIKIQTKAIAASAGYRHDSIDSKTVFSYEFSIFAGQANVLSKDSSFSFLQSGAKTIGGIASIGYGYRPKNQKVSLGFSLPILFQKTEFNWDKDLFKEDSTSTFSTHLALDMSWELYPKLTLLQKLSHPLMAGGESLWIAALGLRF